MSDTAAEAPPRSSRWDENASFWVQIIREHRDKYRNELTEPAMIEAIGPPRAGRARRWMRRGLPLSHPGGARCEGYRDRLQHKTHRSSRHRTWPTDLRDPFDVGSVSDLPYEDAPST